MVLFQIWRRVYTFSIKLLFQSKNNFLLFLFLLSMKNASCSWHKDVLASNLEESVKHFLNKIAISINVFLIFDRYSDHSIEDATEDV